MPLYLNDEQIAQVIRWANFYNESVSINKDDVPILKEIRRSQMAMNVISEQQLENCHNVQKIISNVIKRHNPSKSKSSKNG